MNDVYRESAYRSDAIPELPAGGHANMDEAFQRLPWVRAQNQVVPNTMEVQLAYARLYGEGCDAEEGYPWGASVFSVSKGFLSGLQGLLYMVYMIAWLAFFISFLPLAVSILSLLVNRPGLDPALVVAEAFTYIYVVIAVAFFGGKYGRILLAVLTDKRQRANPTGLYRREGLVRIKKGKEVFEAPFIEFDAYLVHSPSGRGGRYFNLLLQHRYSKHQLWMKGLLTDAMDQKEVYAYWDMIQQFMDVSRPLPDVPVFEPFRHRDPVTAEWDQLTGRDPFKWRKMSPESWREHHEQTYRERLRTTNFHKACILDARIQGRGLPLPDQPQGGMLA